MPRPVAAGVLTIVGGVFIFIGGALFALVGYLAAIFGIGSGFFVLGLLVGALTIVVGLLMLTVPFGHTVWGVIAIGLAFASIPVALAGLIAGFLLVLIGGALSVTWKRPVERFITVEGRLVPPPPG